MADIQRTKADFKTLYADNTTKAILPQTHRDLVESLHQSFGSLSLSSEVETVIGSTGVFVLGAGVTVQKNVNRFTADAAGRLTYIGIPTVHAHIACSFSVISAGNNQDLSVKVAKNGVVDDASHIDFFMGTGAQKHSSATHIDFNMATNDYLELWVANETSTGNLTLTALYLFALGMFR